jgi:rhomboid protease GluP
MESAAEITLAAAPESPADLVAVGDYASAAEADDRGLVILALGLCYWLHPAATGFSLSVERAHEAAVRAQLASYERECTHWPPAPFHAEAPRAPRSGLLIALWALALVGSFWAQERWPAWLEFGALRPAEIFAHGEGWRPFTALFLHGDVGHLLSNAVAGAFVFSAVLGTLGRGRGVLLLTLGAVLGNLFSAALRLGGPYSSIGASTAIFAGLGLLTGRAIKSRVDSAPDSPRSLFVPLGAGVTVLALYGAGGPHVDLGAHLCGFATGLMLGVFHPKPVRG